MTLSLRINDQARTKPPRLIDSDQKGVAKGSPGVFILQLRIYYNFKKALETQFKTNTTALFSFLS